MAQLQRRHVQQQQISHFCFFSRSFAAIRQSASATVPSASPKPHVPLPPTNNNSSWNPQHLRPVPAFYPLEKSTRLVEDAVPNVASRLADCLRALSIQAHFDDQAGTASLLTGDHVEMHLCLWSPPKNFEGVLVELQRRKGDSVAFHRYSRTILDAAIGDLDVNELDVDADVVYSKKIQRMLEGQSEDELENAVVALEIVNNLLMKDRMDARQLGLESLCLLTDPRKTGYLTAVLASHVVLLGNTNGVEIPGSKADLLDEALAQGIQETILGLVQFSEIGEDNPKDAMENSIEAEHLTVLHNLALAVLANSLDVIENPDRFDDEPEDVKPRGRLRTASSTDVTNEFLQASEESSSKEILKTLISELGNAGTKPHDAALSAKCLGSLLRASDEAQKRAKELGAKTVVSTALDVGVRTHAKLEVESQKVLDALQQQPSRTETQEIRREDLEEEEEEEE